MSEDRSQNYGWRDNLAPSISLFASLSTLVCCALPALLVTLGAGAALAGLVSSAPWLITLSKYKVWTFGISGVLILVAGLFRWNSRNAPCPVDPRQAAACMRLRKQSAWLFWASVLVWSVGFFFAFLAVHLLG